MTNMAAPSPGFKCRWENLKTKYLPLLKLQSAFELDSASKRGLFQIETLQQMTLSS